MVAAPAPPRQTFPPQPGRLAGMGKLWQYLGPFGKPFRPFPAQYECLQHIVFPWPGVNASGQPSPLIWCINCGRRFGKTTLARVLTWHALLAPDDHIGPPTVRITADTEEHAYKIWDSVVWAAMNTPLKALVSDYSKSRELLTLKTGATAQMLSANNPNTLSGDGVTAWIIDESQFISQEAWNNLFPSISDRNGQIVAFGVAEGEGPYREMNFRGDDPAYPEYHRFEYPTSANPFVAQWAIDLAERTLPPIKFKQLYLAQWATEAGLVFSNVEGCLDRSMAVTQHPLGYYYTAPHTPGHFYYGGIDLARTTDWTVAVILDRHDRLIAWDKFARTDWEHQENRLFAFSRQYNHPPFKVDATGKGDSVAEALFKRGLNGEEYVFDTHFKKNKLIDAWAVKVAHGQFKFPDHPDAYAIKTEHLRFEAKRSTRSNLVLYGAPSGSHDDHVMACALAGSWVEMPAMPRFSEPHDQLEDPETGDRYKSASEYL